MSIPKTIHYCWFGRKPLDDKSLYCISTWKKYFPDYEIIQWNEKNFDISSCAFLQDAYKAEKWAFVSDIARLVVVYQYGGLYFDTDVEVIGSFDDVLKKSPNGFMGVETTLCVNSGLGFAAPKGCNLLKSLIELYRGIDFVTYKGELSEIACPVLTTRYLLEYGFKQDNSFQTVCGIDIYPSDYFSPIDYYSGQMKKTQNTRSVHWYAASWLSPEAKAEQAKLQRLTRFFGKYMGDRIYGVACCVKTEGIIPYIRKRMLKLLKR